MPRKSRLWSLTAERFESRAAPGAWRRAVIAALGLAAVLVVLLHEQVGNPYSVSDLGDPLFSIWRMGWVTHALSSDPGHLFDGNIFYPQPLALTLSDTILLPAVIGAPFRFLGLHPVVTYNLLMFAGFWVSGVATYVLTERLTGSPRAAFVAGLIYATYSYRFDHYSHLELQMTQWMPMGLLALHLLVSTGRWPYAIGLALAGVAQLYSGMYYAVFFVVYVAVIGAGLVLVQRPRVLPLAARLGMAAALAGVLAVPIVRAFLAAEPIKGERGLDEINFYSASPVDYLRANTKSALWNGTMLPPEPERALFPGAAPIALTLVSLAPPFGAMRMVYAASLLVAVDGSFGMKGLTYPLLHRWVAPFRGLRSPARFAALVGLSLAILSGFGALRVLRACRSRVPGNVVFAVLIGLVALDAWPTLNLAPVWPDPPPIYEGIRDKPGVVIAEFPVRSDPAFNLAFMYFSLWHWMPMVNGYSGFIPQSYAEISRDLEEFPIGKSIARLQERGATHAIVNCGIKWIGLDDCATIMRRAEREEALTLVSRVEWAGAPVALYAIKPQTTAATMAGTR